MYITYGKNSYNTSIAEELLSFTYEQSTQELLEDVYSEGLDLNDPDQLLIAKERERISYFSFLEEFLNAGEKDQFIAAYKSNDRIVTALRMIEMSQGHWFLEALETAPSERGKGYGKAIVAAVIEDLKRRKGITIKTHINKSNINSINLHKACGFIQTERPAIDEEGYSYKNSYEFEYLFADKMNHLGTMRIETNRLILRKFEKNDSSHMFKNWGSDSKVTEFLSWKPHKDVKETDEILDSWILKYENENIYNWVIELKDIQEVVGNIKVVKLEESNAACEIGYCIGSEFWNRGITSEALESVIEFLFSKIHLNRISAKHDILNLASGMVMKKCNMIYEGTLRDVQFKNNRFCTLSIYSILKNEWIELNRKG